MSKRKDGRIQRRMVCYVARDVAARPLAPISSAYAKRAQRAKIKARLVQYVART